MCDDLTEAKMPNSAEAFDGAVFTAKNMVNALKRNYSDEIVKMAFEVALNEAKESLFEAIYDASTALREDASGSFASYAKKVQGVLRHPEDYCAAVMYRHNNMAFDNTITEQSVSDFKNKLKKQGVTDANLLFMGELYFYIVKFGKNFEPAILKPGKILPSAVSQMYLEYKKLPVKMRDELKAAVSKEWNKQDTTVPNEKNFFQRLLNL